MATFDDFETTVNRDNNAWQLSGWRFPRSRRHLWDRQLVAERTNLSPTTYLPETTLSTTAVKAITGDNDVDQIAMTLSWSNLPDQKQRLRVDYNPDVSDTSSGVILASQLHLDIATLAVGALQCICHLATQNDEEIVKRIKNRLSDQFNAFCNDIVSFPNTYDLFPLALSRHTLNASGETIIEGFLALTDAALNLSPIYMKNIINTTLASNLKTGMQKERDTKPQVGMLSMDTCRRLIPLLSDDSNARIMPLVGVWVSGIQSISDPLILATCLRFHFTKSVADKAMLGDAFLLLFYGNGEWSAKLYECAVDGSQLNPPLSFQTFRLLGRHLNGSSGSEVKIKWKPEPSPEQPERPCKSIPRIAQRSEWTAAVKRETRDEIDRVSDAYSDLQLNFEPSFSFTTTSRVQNKRTRVTRRLQETKACLQKSVVQERREQRTSQDAVFEEVARTGENNQLRFVQNDSMEVKSVTPVVEPSAFGSGKRPALSRKDITADAFGSCDVIAAKTSDSISNSEHATTSSPVSRYATSQQNVEITYENGHPPCACEAVCANAALQLEVESLKQRVATLELRVEQLQAHSHVQPIYELQATPIRPSSETYREPTQDSMALVPVGRVREATRTPTPLNDLSSSPRQSSGQLGCFAESPSPSAQLATHVSDLLQPDSVDLAHLIPQSCIEITISEPEFDDIELEKIARKYLGQGMQR